MKTSLLLIAIIISAACFGQVQGVHKEFPVKVLDSLHTIDSLNALNPSLKLDTSFRHNPNWLSITVTDVANFTAYQLQSTLSYKEDFAAPYTAKYTQTSSSILIPKYITDLAGNPVLDVNGNRKKIIDFEAAINPITGKLIITELNKILKLYGLQADPDSPLNTGNLFTAN